MFQSWPSTYPKLGARLFFYFWEIVLLGQPTVCDKHQPLGSGKITLKFNSENCLLITVYNNQEGFNQGPSSVA